MNKYFEVYGFSNFHHSKPQKNTNQPPKDLSAVVALAVTTLLKIRYAGV